MRGYNRQGDITSCINQGGSSGSSGTNLDSNNNVKSNDEFLYREIIFIFVKLD